MTDIDDNSSNIKIESISKKYLSMLLK